MSAIFILIYAVATGGVIRRSQVEWRNISISYVII